MVGTRSSPKIHHDGPESFPVEQQPGANLDPNRLRRLSFGGRGGAAKKTLPALERGGARGPLVPLPIERPKFHHGEARPKRPKASRKAGHKTRSRVSTEGRNAHLGCTADILRNSAFHMHNFNARDMRYDHLLVVYAVTLVGTDPRPFTAVQEQGIPYNKSISSTQTSIHTACLVRQAAR